MKIKEADEVTKDVYKKDIVGDMISGELLKNGGSLEKTAYAMGTTPVVLLKEIQQYEMIRLLTRENS